MRIRHSSQDRIVVYNVGGWAMLHSAITYGGMLLPWRWFGPDTWLFRTRRWEQDGMLYERLFRVKRWKRRLPDGARVLGFGFHMNGSPTRNPERLERFVRETCRAELVHWALLSSSVVFFHWNTVRIGWFMVAYALAANLPCIVAQRYNRPIPRRIAAAGRGRDASDGPLSR
jgi:glycosyl-4,4'-diaponeurosporenoate acyltransferase